MASLVTGYGATAVGNTTVSSAESLTRTI